MRFSATRKLIRVARRMQKGELTNVKPQAKTVSKAFVQQVKEKEATITLTAEEKVGPLLVCLLC